MKANTTATISLPGEIKLRQSDEPEKMLWSRWLEDLQQLQNIDVDRCFKPKTFGAVKP